MRALTVIPLQAGSAAVTDMPEPEPGPGELLVDGIALGVCGTDREIAGGEYGWAPAGSERLILGHESLGRVREAPEGSGFAAGDLVVGVVRRPDPVPRARHARTASSTSAATGATPSAGSRSGTATAPSAGRSRPTTPSSSIRRSSRSGC